MAKEALAREQFNWDESLTHGEKHPDLQNEHLCSGGGGKSILDIQREESLQAKRRATQQAAMEAEMAAAAAAAPHHAPSSWGKSVLRPNAPSGKYSA